MCDAHPWGDSDGLACTRTDAHLIGHTYASSTGSEVPDKHTEHVDD
jgi:hypothetical protein